MILNYRYGLIPIMKTLSAILILLACGWSVTGQIIRIPADYPSIQEGIEAAKDLDTVLVAEGTYQENIRFRGKAITLTSHYLLDGDTAHISRTIIDGSKPPIPDSASTVIFGDGEDSTSVLCGFTITRGGGTLYNNALSGLYLAGGGILMVEKSGGTVEHNIIRDNHLMSANKIWGGGMLIMLGGDTGIVKTIIIQHNKFLNNSITSSSGGGSSGGGIKVGIGKDVERGRFFLQNNIISHNEVKNTAKGNAFGGGMNFGMVLPTAPGEYIIRNNVFSHNRVSGSAWVVAGGFSIIHILESTEEFFDSLPAPEIYNNIVCNNHSTGYAGGIVIYTNYAVNRTVNCLPQPILANNTIFDNSSPSPAGIYSYLSKPVLFNNIFWNDLSTYNAGEIYYSGELHAFHNDFQDIRPVSTNISQDPLFGEDYHLSSGSPCIGRGIDSINVQEYWYHAPRKDYMDHDRPDPIGSNLDLGAIESPLPTGNYYCLMPENDRIVIHPNPILDQVIIETRDRSPIRSVTIIDLSGRTVLLLTGLNKHEIVIPKGEMKEGVYFFRIRTEMECIKKVIIR
jgi:hypothetical protein